MKTVDQLLKEQPLIENSEAFLLAKKQYDEMFTICKLLNEIHYQTKKSWAGINLEAATPSELLAIP